MNQRPTPERLAYSKRQLDELSKILATAEPETAKEAAERLCQQQLHAKAEQTKRQLQFPPLQKRPPEKLPDPWLFDSESLLRELDRCRELVLEIPITNPNATHFGINVAVSAIWNLRDTLRHLLGLHREGQRAFAKQSDVAEHKQPTKTSAHPASKIVGVRA